MGCECFVSETVRYEDGCLWSKRLKACLNWDLLCCGGHNIHIGTTVRGARWRVCVCVCVCVCVLMCVFMSVCVCIIGDGLWLTCVYVMLSQRTAKLRVRQLTVFRRARVCTPTSRTNRRDGQMDMRKGRERYKESLEENSSWIFNGSSPPGY